jgi:hypothetical protein
VGGEGLGAEGRLAQDDAVDRLADDLLEAGHVDAGLTGVEVDEAFELGEVEVLGALRLDADHLLDAGDADPREADLGRGAAGLDVGGGGEGCLGVHGHSVGQGRGGQERREKAGIPGPWPTRFDQVFFGYEAGFGLYWRRQS